MSVSNHEMPLKLSVIMPVYNAESHIEDAVSSILNQTFEEFEFVIVDDCSTDSSYALLQDFAKNDDRIKLYRNKKNSKISYTLNRAMKIASGEYIARMDADDISLPTRFSVQLQYLANHSDISLVGSGVYYIDDIGRQIGCRNSICGSSLIEKIIELRSPIAHPTWMFRRRDLEKIGGYREVVPAEDYDILLRLNFAGIKFDNVPEKLLKYRLSGTGTVFQAGLKQRKAFNYVLSLYRKKKSSGKELFSENLFMKHTQATTVSESLFKCSQSVFNMASRYKHEGRIVPAIFLYLLACILSFYQCQFIFRGFKSRAIIKSINK